MTLMRKVVALLVIAIIVMGLYPLMVTKATHPSQLSAYDEDDDDLSVLKSKLEQEGYTTKALLSSPQMLKQMESDEINNSVLFIAGMENKYSEFEAKALRDFMNAGGSVVLADDYGYGNTAISGFQSVGVSFYNKPLYDIGGWARWSPGENASIIRLVAKPTTINDQTYHLFWSSATGLITTKSVTTHAYTSQNSFVDKNNDGIGGPEEVANRSAGGIPAIVEVKAGNGRMILLGDPSMFINGLIERNDNWAFTRDMVGYLSKGTPKETTIIFEESRHLQSNILNSIYVQLFGYLAYGAGNMVVKIIALAGLILGLEFILMRVNNPVLFRHIYNPAWGRTSRWRVPHTHYLDPMVVREVILERVRVTHGLACDDFEQLPPSQLEGMIRDPVLIGFLLNKDERMPLEDVLQAMDRWTK